MLRCLEIISLIKVLVKYGGGEHTFMSTGGDIGGSTCRQEMKMHMQTKCPFQKE